MGRRRRTALAKFSLFSFQDIITCLMGIMLLLTLLIALQIVEHPVRSSAQISDRRAALEATIAKLEQQTAELRQQANLNRQMLASGALTNSELLAPQVDEAITAHTAAATELKQLQAAAAAQAQAAASAVRAAGEVRASSTAERLRLVSEMSRMQSLLDNVQMGNRVIYNSHRGAAGTCWIVEVTNDATIHAAPMGRAQKPLLLGDTEAALSWIRAERRRGSEFLILLKPDAANATDLIPETLRNERIPHGYDLLGQDQTALDPERGAAAL
jgi:cell division protein FtsB